MNRCFFSVFNPSGAGRDRIPCPRVAPEVIYIEALRASSNAHGNGMTVVLIKRALHVWEKLAVLRKKVEYTCTCGQFVMLTNGSI